MLFKILLVAIVIVAGSLNASATIVTHTFSATSGSIDSNISFTTEKNSSANVPAFSVNLRLYYATSGDGCSITLTPANGAVISDIKITGVTAYLPTMKYNVDGGADATATLANTTYTISGIAASKSLKIRNGNTTNTQLRITAIEVTYTSCTASNIAFANPTVTKAVGDANFTQAPSSLSSGAITYASSATNIASVNPNSGEVTIAGTGSATITASQAAVTPYCGNSATYTLNVTATPTLALTDVTDLALISNTGSSVSQTINVSAVNLSTDLGMAISGPNAGLFALSQYTVTQTGGNVPVTAVTITYSPILAGSHTATLTMASTGAMNVSRSLNGNAVISGVNNVQNNLNIFVENKNIKFEAKAGEIVNIYNATGQRVIHSVSNEGLNSISGSSLNGVLLVRVGNRLGKVIL